MSKNENQEDFIRERAFELWIEEGQPDGKDKDHWEKAEAEIKKLTVQTPAVGPSPGP